MTHIILLIGNGEYAEGLASFLNEKPGEGLRAVPYTSASVCNSYLRSSQTDCIVYEESFEEELEAPEEICRIKLTTDVESTDGIYMFKGMDFISGAILSRLRSLDRPDFSKTVRPGTSDGSVTSISCVCSPVGGAYVSSFAYALALYHCAKERTLFVSFDPFFAPPGMEGVRETGTSSLLLRLDMEDDLEAGLEKIVTVTGQGPDMIYGVGHWIDICEFQPLHVEKLMTLLRSCGYAHVIIDAGLFGRPMKVLLEGATRILVPTAGRESSYGFKEWKRQLDLIGIDSSHVVMIEPPYDAGFADTGMMTGQSREPSRTTILRGPLGRFIEELEGSSAYKGS